jgi:dihydrofolate reductase
MRKIVAYELVSLDGVAERPDEFITDWDDAMDKNLARVISSQDTVLLGHQTYDDWAAFWPTSVIEPFASFINGVEKFVMSSTTPKQPWANAVVIDGDLSRFVTELKERSGGDIGVHGSITLVNRCSTSASSTNCDSSSLRPCTCMDANSSTGAHLLGWL